MKRMLAMVVTTVLLSLLVHACAPKPAPTSPATVAPSSTQQAAVSPLMNTSTAVSIPTTPAADAQWAKTVDAAKKEGKLVFLGSTPVSGDMGTAISKAFEEKTGIHLDILPGRGGSNYERIKTEKRSGQREASLVEASGLYLKLMKSDGLLAPAKDLPVLQDANVWLTHPLALDPDGYLVVFLKNWFGPYVNTKVVKQEDWPSSFQDFLKPQWKGKLLLTDPRTGSGTYWYYTTFVKRGITTWDYAKSLQTQDLKLSPNGGAAAQSLARGEVPISLISFAADTSSMVAAGAPIKALSLKDGDIYSLEAISIVDGGPATNAAKVFLNWFLGEEGQKVYASVAKHNPIRKDTPNLQPQDVVPPDQTTKKIAVTMDDLADAEKLFNDGYMAQLLGLSR